MNFGFNSPRVLRDRSMRSRFLLILLALNLYLPIGCQNGEPEVQSKMHQVLSALQIPDKTDRDSALAAACRECAAAGDIESILLGLPKVSDTQQRDDIAEECFRSFAASGRKDDAKKLIELIGDSAKRSNLSMSLTAA